MCPRTGETGIRLVAGDERATSVRLVRRPSRSLDSRQRFPRRACDLNAGQPFVDTSRNGRRAYCSARCANTDAVRRHRRK
ncbi:MULTISPECIES: CGNR zinc finger domain-containing protein [Streptomyces]|uniref:CGNR zinc finger domain-containing protein n=1 Tax=Streptomyces TaxID=1883 RepID=UPI0018FEB79F